MVEKIGLNFQQYNYNTTTSATNLQAKQVENKTVSKPNFTATQPQICSFTNNNAPVTLRTMLTTKEDKRKYTEILSMLDKTGKRVMENLLKTGVLLNNESNDRSSVLDNLYKIATEPRAKGLDNGVILKDTIATIYYPYIITQRFGNIPKEYVNSAIQAKNNNDTNLINSYKDNNDDIHVEHSGTCVAASTEFKLAKQLPAEFARFAQELSSPKLSVTKTIRMNNLTDTTLGSVYLLNAFETPHDEDNLDVSTLTFAPDKAAILRAHIQTVDKDPYERSPLDVLMQSTFMQVGSQQSYNSITDKRAGKFNQNEKGLIEFEKTYTESVVFDKNILSVTYQILDDNAKLIGYETDFDTMKRHLTTAIDEGENVILGYTMTDNNNIVVNGHEITVVDYKKGEDGKLTFICNDTDDNNPMPIEYPEDYLLPKIHHAALPQHIVEKDLDVVPSWVEGIEMYKEMKKAQRQAA